MMKDDKEIPPRFFGMAMRAMLLMDEIHEDPEQNDFYLTIVQGGFLLGADFGARKEGWFLGNFEGFFPTQSLSSSNYVTENVWIDIPYFA